MMFALICGIILGCFPFVVGTCIDINTVGIPGWYLPDKADTVLDNVSLYACLAECLVIRQCQSLNFDLRFYRCSLNNEANKTSGSLVKHRDFIYADGKSWPKELMGGCAGFTCDERSKCVINTTTKLKLPKCVPVITGCDEPHAVANAAIGQGPYVTGSTRNYTCNHGYTGWNSAQVTCLPNGSWSSMNFYCTRLIYDYTPDPVTGLLFKMSERKMTWGQGRHYCQDEGGSLIKIINQQHLLFFEDIFKSAGPVTISYLFVGVTDEGEEGKWTWLDGTDINADLWNDKSPDNYGGYEDCAVMDRNTGWKLGDVYCRRTYRCLCSRHFK